MTNWFPDKERGTAWGTWNISHNIGGGLAPLVAGTASKLGWRYGMWIPGLIGIVIASLCFYGTKTSPESIGLESAESFGKSPEENYASKRPGYSHTDDANLQNGDRTGTSTIDPNELPNKTLAETEMGSSASIIDIFTSPKIILLALSYFFLHIVRQGVSSWSSLYFVQKKGVDVAHASVILSGFELGGLIGSFVLGKVSDLMIKKSSDTKTSSSIDGDDGYVGKRIKISLVYLCLLVAMLLALYNSPKVSNLNTHSLNWIIVAMLGFALYGPQMSIGLIGAEIVPKKLVGASQGFLGIVAYTGAAYAGVPLASNLQQHGWEWIFNFMIVCTCMTGMLLSPLWNAKSFAQTDPNMFKKRNAIR